MKERRLGRSDLEVVPFCFGGNVFGWTADEKTSFALLDALCRSGINFIDTADAYSRWVPGHTGGKSETILGRWMKQRGNRDKVIVATKVGADMGSGRTMAPSYVRKAVEESLKRLRTDRIDLYQTHWDDENTPLEEVLSTYRRADQAGKVRAIGASNYSAARLRKRSTSARAKACRATRPCSRITIWSSGRLTRPNSAPSVAKNRSASFLIIP